MCLRLRYTDSRGRSGVPLIFLRNRRWRRLRPSARVSFAISLYLQRHPSPTSVGHFAGLAGLTTHALALVTDALAQIRLRRPDAADLGGERSEERRVGKESRARGSPSE